MDPKEKNTMAEKKHDWNVSQLRKYNIKYEQIPRYDVSDPKVDELISENKPVVITNSNLVASALKWDLDYLERNWANANHTVFASHNYKFKYYDPKKVNPDFTPPIRHMDMKLSEFVRRVRSWKKGDERLYLQQALNSTVGPAIVRDFLNFRWDWITSKQKKHSWGPLTSNLLLVGMEGNVTPCHYDEQQNFFAQIYGNKRFLLFPPEQFDCFYPYPVYHPHDRQSQVDFEKPDYTRFPKFRSAFGKEAVLEPGDVLYVPVYWWHHVESLMRGGYTISVNFWYKAGPTETVVYPLKDHQKVAITRNVEKMLLEVLKDPKEVGPILRSLVLGRYTE